MASEYLYGAYGHIADTVVQSAVQTGTVPVYVGVAPVHLVRGYKEAGVINSPVKISEYTDAQTKLGYSADWAAFSLCEVFNAHFNNSKGNIGPAYVINVLNPDFHRKDKETEKALVFTNGRAEFVSDTVILDTFKLIKPAEDEESESDPAYYIEGEDYALDYNFTKNSVIITSLKDDAPLSGSVDATFWEADDEKVTPSDIIGGVTANGEYSGIGALALLYQKEFAITNILAAPGWSHYPEVYNALVAAAYQINGHWNAFVLADIPLVEDGTAAAINTIDKAVKWKTDHAYTSERSKVFWPEALDIAGNVYHLSTLASVELMRADYSHDSVPMETCGNKAVPVIKQYFGANSVNNGFDQQQGKKLTSKGISTVVAWGGEWVLWGDHTAAYTYAEAGSNTQTDPRAIFDVSMRMLMYITNLFQNEWSPKIDKPMDRALKDQIINREQEKLDGYVAIGALIGNPRVLFLESANSTDAVMNGDFVWDIKVTPTPPLKSATANVAYTSEGFSAYFKGGE